MPPVRSAASAGAYVRESKLQPEQHDADMFSICQFPGDVRMPVYTSVRPFSASHVAITTPLELTAMSILFGLPALVMNSSRTVQDPAELRAK